jgi:hypothetical protein
MGTGTCDDLELSGAEDDLTVQHDEELILVLVVVKRRTEAARSNKLDNAHGAGVGATHLDGGEMIQEVKVPAFMGREHLWLWADGCVFVTHAAMLPHDPFENLTIVVTG